MSKMPNQHHLVRYNNFISALKGQVVEGYSEKHHIVPRSHGGSNKKDNLVALTPRQHFIAHRMLWKAYGGSMARAFFLMNQATKYGKVGSKTYAMAREDYAKQVAIQMTGKPAQGKFDAEHRAKLSQAKLGTKVSDATKAKISAFQKGRKHDAEFSRRVSEAKKGKDNGRTGYQQSQEARSKIAIGNINRPLLSCRGCKNTFKLHGGVKRWHLENCKGTQL